MVIQTDLIEMRHIVGDLVHDITGMKQGSLYFLAYDTGTWDLCVVLTPANPRVRESQQSVNCDFVEEDGAQRQSRHCTYCIQSSSAIGASHVLQVLPSSWMRMECIWGRW